MRRGSALGVALAALLLAGPARAQDVPGVPRVPGVVDVTLDNGLRVLVLEDRRAPVVAVQVWYRVGSRDERVGQTGLSHFLEHLMFKGTARVGSGEYARRVEGQGGEHNAFTSRDATAYHVDVAAERVETVLLLEADRMTGLRLDAREVESERKVILEERRTRTEDDPVGDLWEAFNLAAYVAHPYRLPVIGFARDIAALTPDDVRAWYRTYYGPGNAILVVVGDVRPPAVLDRVRALFGAVPASPAAPRLVVVEPEPRGPRRVEVRREAKLPVILTGYPAPAANHPDAPALDVLATVLAGGRAARLPQRLVHELRLALDAGGDYDPLSLDPAMLTVQATALPGRTPEELERGLLAEVGRVRTDLVEEEELLRARNQLEAAFVFGQDSAHARAHTLARYELTGGWRRLDAYLPAIRAVTREDLRRVAAKYLLDARRTTAVLVPTTPPERP